MKRERDWLRDTLLVVGPAVVILYTCVLLARIGDTTIPVFWRVIFLIPYICMVAWVVVIHIKNDC